MHQQYIKSDIKVHLEFKLQKYLYTYRKYAKKKVKINEPTSQLKLENAI